MADSSNHNDKLRDNFQKATAAALRAVSEKPLTDVSYGLIPSQDASGKVRLTNYIKGELPPYYEFLRGESDSAASRLRFHNHKLHTHLQPQTYQARELFDAFEYVRGEAMAASEYKGVRHNIQQRYDQFIRKDASTDNPPLYRLFQMLAWQALDGNEEINAQMAQAIHPELPQILHKNRKSLLISLPDQQKFAAVLRDMLHQLGLEKDHTDEAEEEDNIKGENDEESQENSPQSAEAQHEQEQTEGQQPSPSDDMGASEAQESEQQTQQTDANSKALNSLPLSRYWETEGQFQYKAFTTEYDEIINAENLCTPQELPLLRASLDQYLSYIPPIVTRLANKLQRRLLAQQMRSWTYDQEEGVLDPTRLPRLIMNPIAQNYHMRERQTDFNDTVVTLLLDNSGSMRGRPIILAALSADILARTLERCGVKVEILGFTTKSWKGGQPYEKWISAGKPGSPGRLNDLRHIIYKGADASYRRTKQNLGVMLKEGLLKENIDGEALLWAHGRLIARRESRKILMVISDGAPVDDLTTSANGGIYLEQHLRGVIQWIESKSPVELVAIGIGHDVTRYYQNAVTIGDVEQLGPVMLGQLGKLFE
ncbi:MAG: cobaltochelatase subunit CobT [Alphaproteobacteria bacterium]|nr:MAG: cobaltochelatase subunit CobT [Alphaproteobacteria bacterium]